MKDTEPVSDIPFDQGFTHCVFSFLIEHTSMDLSMTQEAWNKISKTHGLFKRIIAPLKQHLNINFGYMIVFNDGSYYKIIENLDCLKKWVTNVESSHIFCARNVTTYFDEQYNFTIWPEEPTCLAMEIYKEYRIWNGITVSRQYKDHTELYWFTKEKAESYWHKWFVRNKLCLLEFMTYFEKYKDALSIKNHKINKELFALKQGFGINLSISEYSKNESLALNRMINLLKSDPIRLDNISKTTALSPRELEVFTIIGRGYSSKITAEKLGISIKTVQYHVEHIKLKTGLHFKSDIIKCYEEYLE